MAAKWLKYNTNQHTHNPISVKDVLSNKPNISHTEMFEIAKRQAILNFKDEDNNYVFLQEYNGQEEIGEVTYFDKYFNECEISDAVYFVDFDEWKFVEINNNYDTYTVPPKLLCIRRNILKSLGEATKLRYIIDLTPWWDMTYNIVNEIKNPGIVSELLDEYPYNEIIHYDYVNEKATLENRVEMKTRKIPFGHINSIDTLNINY